MVKKLVGNVCIKAFKTSSYFDKNIYIDVFDCSDEASEESLLNYLDQLPPLPEQGRWDFSHLFFTALILFFAQQNEIVIIHYHSEQGYFAKDKD